MFLTFQGHRIEAMMSLARQTRNGERSNKARIANECSVTEVDYDQARRPWQKREALANARPHESLPQEV